jgi:hypothetical protein
VFFFYWLSHVPSSRFEPFWRLVGNALAPDGRVFLIDSTGAQSNPGGRKPSGTSHREHDDLERQTSTRELDGRAYHVVKVAWHPGELAARLAALGWSVRLVSGELSFWGRSLVDLRAVIFRRAR